MHDRQRLRKVLTDATIPAGWDVIEIARSSIYGADKDDGWGLVLRGPSGTVVGCSVLDAENDTDEALLRLINNKIAHAIKCVTE